MQKLYLHNGLVIATGIALSGCTAIDMSKLQISDFTGYSQCTAPVAAAQPDLRAASLASADQEVEIAFILPRLAQAGTNTREAKLTTGATRTHFQVLDDSTATVVSSKLPQALQGDDVVEAVRRSMVKASAQAQINVAKASRTRVANTQTTEVANYVVPSLSQSQVKSFANKLFVSGLRPTFNSSGTMSPSSTVNRAAEVNRAGTLPADQPSTTTASITDTSIAAYFAAFYEGKFVDRLGQPVQKPQISINGIPIALTITDAQITAAETVLIEYIADLIDPTPVLGDAETEAQISPSTKFYPAGTTAVPTAYTTKLGHYQFIPAQGCGLTRQNAVILSDVSNSAADSAGAVSGLVAQSAGGITIGLGILGKISIGDNQTLGTIIKTAASRFGARITLASSYWIMTTVANPQNRDAGGNIIEFK
jgi:hypothetical protein